MKKIIIVTFIFLCLISPPCHSAHLYKESVYQQAWAKLHNGICEYRNDDGTRVDCLTETHAVEFDFANKWAESVGQALYYQHKTGKRAMVVLILENPDKQMVYLERVKSLSKIYDFDVDFVTPELVKNSPLLSVK